MTEEERIKVADSLKRWFWECRKGGPRFNLDTGRMVSVMTDLEEMVRDAAADFCKKGGVVILVGDHSTSIGVHGLSQERCVEALEDALEYIRDFVRGNPAGHTIVRRV